MDFLGCVGERDFRSNLLGNGEGINLTNSSTTLFVYILKNITN